MSFLRRRPLTAESPDLVPHPNSFGQDLSKRVLLRSFPLIELSSHRYRRLGLRRRASLVAKRVAGGPGSLAEKYLQLETGQAAIKASPPSPTRPGARARPGPTGGGYFNDAPSELPGLACGVALSLSLSLSLKPRGVIIADASQRWRYRSDVRCPPEKISVNLCIPTGVPLATFTRIVNTWPLSRITLTLVPPTLLMIRGLP